MLSTLAWTAFLMGLAGGPHCVGMCAAPCAAVTSVTLAPSIQLLQPLAPLQPVAPRWSQTLSFQAGRLLGYSLLGAAAATAMESAAWLSAHTSVLKPLWTLMHTAVLAWGLMLLVLARQPVWSQGTGRTWFSRGMGKLKPALARRDVVFATGALWALMPCGLLYSALLVAALSGGVWQGAFSMAVFAAGSGLSLVAGPLLWRRWMAHLGAGRADAARRAAETWGTRFAGLVLCSLAAWSLWHDQMRQFAQWCGLPV